MNSSHTHEKSASQFFLLRSCYGLSVAQAAQAMQVNTAIIEALDQGIIASILSEEGIKRNFELYLATTNDDTERNLLFNSYPLNLAQKFLDCSQKQVAARYGYSLEEWRAFEYHSDILPRPILTNLERLIRESLKKSFE